MTDDQTVTQALEPCPFCGGEAVEATSKGPTGERYRWVHCTDCGAMTECCDDSARHNNPDEPEPVDLWNTRIESTRATGGEGLEYHTSDEEGGMPDVGVLLRLGENEALWIGEITRAEATEHDVTDSGWHMVYHKDGGRIYVGAIHDGGAAIDLAETLAHRTAHSGECRNNGAGGDRSDIEPLLDGCASPEPSLREIVRRYYSRHFDQHRADQLTDDYFAALSRYEGAKSD